MDSECSELPDLSDVEEKVDVKVDVGAVSDLMDILSHIKQANGDVYDDLIHDPSEFEIHEENFRMPAVSKSLRRLRKSRNVLRVLLRIAVSKIDVLENNCMPYFFEKGIKALPDELLRHIFEVGYEDEDININGCANFSVHVSGISRHFRRVALGSPCIWKRLHSGMSPELLAMLTSRSKNIGLHIRLNTWHLEEDRLLEFARISQFMQIAATHCRRWESFELDSHRVWSAISILRQYSNLDLPRLSSLSLRVAYLHEQEVTKVGSIASSWILPRNFLQCLI
ncbi:hypothetical protein BD410DRAFT_54008 [Rickenella mellea]|uniref:F-box domain-containing protein n=1 Tax=Rickenella mellea TaxID=50990 RepID=A0A4R5XG32_9AGAM|nr:hypothetical protein BD410DRAFT_54008 [Rickenella mellea]